MDIDTKKKKLKYRSLRRGTKEADSVIGGFVHKIIENLDDKQLIELENLLDISDPDLMDITSIDKPKYVNGKLTLLSMLRQYQMQLLEK
ncbi:MAG: succinate dehydrogenase assembly factor 2 [Pseudomonadota bacterium]|nr:succinate dehydrogenase assembly factor 2 [Pseudomonadota bacterium]